jgi:hypothetical protein
VGSRLVGEASFVLTTLDGRQVLRSIWGPDGSSMELTGLRKGVYVAKGAGASKMISVF